MARTKRTKKKTQTLRVVLAEGEATGHAHVATGRALRFQEGILTLEEEATVTHEEHGTRVLPALPEGYEVRKVKELDPAGDVVDVRD